MMLVDCQTCPVRDVHCADCMVTALTGTPLRLDTRPGGSGGSAFPDPQGAATPTPGTAPLDRAERRAVAAFLAAGLVTTATANAARAELDRTEGAPAQAPGTRWAV